MESKAMTLRLSTEQAEALEKVAEVDGVSVTKTANLVTGDSALHAPAAASEASQCPGRSGTLIPADVHEVVAELRREPIIDQAAEPSATLLRVVDLRLLVGGNIHVRNRRPMHTTAPIDQDHGSTPELQLVTLPEAAAYLAIGRSALYILLGRGDLASVYIGRSRRIPMGELRRFIRHRLAA